MHQVALHGVDLVVAGDGALDGAVDVDLEDRGQEAAGVEQERGFLAVQRDADRGLLGAVDDGGHFVFTTHCTGGSLASPFARFGLQNLGRGHVVVSK